MRRRIFLYLFLAAAILLLATPALAMVSTGYTLDWFTPLTGSGGSSQSTHYTMHLTVGQTVIGGQESALYKAGLGFWYGRLIDYVNFVPVIRR